MMVVAALLPALGSAASAQPDGGCPAGDALIALEYLQSGFSGSTGERTSIGDDGCFTVDRVVNGKAVERLRSGLLNPDRVATLRAAIEAANIMSLPDRSGAAPPVNPATLSISYQGVTKTVVAPPGTGIEGMKALGDGALARLAAVLVELTGPG
jgi:hypothetical protein